MANEPPADWFKDILKFCEEMKVGIDEIDTLLTKNKIWVERNQAVGAYLILKKLLTGVIQALACALQVWLWI